VIEFTPGVIVLKYLFLIALVIPSLLFGYEAYLSIPEDPIAGREVQMILSIFNEYSFPYEGEADLQPSFGKFLENSVELFGGSAFLKYYSEKSGMVYVKATLDDGEATFHFHVLPDYSKMKESYFELIDFGGYVSVKRKGSEFYEPVAEGTRFYEGDEIWVQEESFAVLEGPGGNRVEIAPNSKVRVKRVRKGEKTVFIRLEVEKGEIVSKVIKELFNTVLLVDGKGVTAGVRGTILGMEVSDAVKIRNFEGNIWVKAGGRYEDLPKMKMMVFTDEALREFENAQKKVMEEFEKLEKEVLGEFEEKARDLFSTFGMEDVFTIDMRDLIKPLDKDLSSFEEMLQNLRQKWEGGN
jgi:hypothetical protein